MTSEQRLPLTKATTARLVGHIIRNPAVRGLYAITPETPDSNLLFAKVGHAIAGGATTVQYRSKQLTTTVAKAQATMLRTMTRVAGTLFIVNDNVDLALSVGADGVHLGREDGDTDAIRRLKEQCAMHTPFKSFVVGVSCYNELQRAESAVAAGADYVAFGSFFDSPTKPHAAKADVALIRAAKAKLDVPVVAIGGITVANASQLISANVDAVAVVTALFDADDIERRARDFVTLFDIRDHVRQ